MKIVILGAGNTLLSDEGVGVHLVRRLEARHRFPEDVELVDAGTFGLLAGQYAEEADLLYIVDALAVEGTPGRVIRYTGEELRTDRMPVKLGPHQMGLLDMLAMAEMRQRTPAEVHVFGVIPESLDTGETLSPSCAAALDEIEAALLCELKARGCGAH